LWGSGLAEPLGAGHLAAAPVMPSLMRNPLDTFLAT